jgi:hypothetical protein
MRIRTIVLIALISGGVLEMLPIGHEGVRTAQAQPLEVYRPYQPPANSRKKARTASQGTQIACTVLGCAPIPRGCSVEKGYTFDGLPSGYDVIACPFR